MFCLKEVSPRSLHLGYLEMLSEGFGRESVICDHFKVPAESVARMRCLRSVNC